MKNPKCKCREWKYKDIVYQGISWILSALFIILSGCPSVAYSIRSEVLRLIVSFTLPLIVLTMYTIQSFIIYYKNKWGKERNDYLFMRGIACSMLWVIFIFCKYFLKGHYTPPSVFALASLFEILTMALIVVFSLIWILHAMSRIQIRVVSILILLLCILSIGKWEIYVTVAAAITYVMENIKPVAFIIYRIILEDDEYNKGVIKRNIVILHAFTCVLILTLAVTDWIHDVAKFSFFNPFWLSDDDKQTAFYSIMQELSDRVVVFAVISLLACFIYSKIQNHIESAIRRNFKIVTETD